MYKNDNNNNKIIIYCTIQNEFKFKVIDFNPNGEIPVTLLDHKIIIYIESLNHFGLLIQLISYTAFLMFSP